jgi:hypothetical protein
MPPTAGDIEAPMRSAGSGKDSKLMRIQAWGCEQRLTGSDGHSRGADRCLS